MPKVTFQIEDEVVGTLVCGRSEWMRFVIFIAELTLLILSFILLSGKCMTLASNDEIYPGNHNRGMKCVIKETGQCEGTSTDWASGTVSDVLYATYACQSDTWNISYGICPAYGFVLYNDTFVEDERIVNSTADKLCEQQCTLLVGIKCSYCDTMYSDRNVLATIEKGCIRTTFDCSDVVKLACENTIYHPVMVIYILLSFITCSIVLPTILKKKDTDKDKCTQITSILIQLYLYFSKICTRALVQFAHLRVSYTYIVIIACVFIILMPLSMFVCLGIYVHAHRIQYAWSTVRIKFVYMCLIYMQSGLVGTYVMYLLTLTEGFDLGTIISQFSFKITNITSVIAGIFTGLSTISLGIKCVSIYKAYTLLQKAKSIRMSDELNEMLLK